MYFFKVELLADLSCWIVAKDVGLVHELCGSNTGFQNGDSSGLVAQPGPTGRLSLNVSFWSKT